MSNDSYEDAKFHANSASLASLNGKFDDALEHLVLAAEKYMVALRACSSREERTELYVAFDECVEEAEKIKQRILAPKEHLKRLPLRKRARNMKTTRIPSKKEKVLLLKSSKIGSLVLPIWNSDKVDSQLASAVSDEFVDPAPLSAILSQAFQVSWERISKVWPDAVMTSDDQVIHTTLVQSYLNDCSLVATLIVVAQWESRFRERLVTCNIFPQNDKGDPVMHESGTYLVKVWFNGVERLIKSDDMVPVTCKGSQTSRACALSQSRNYPNVFWPALVEKLYLRTIASCSPSALFRGSNSASDIYALTGWIPEEIKLRGSLVDVDALQKRLLPSWAKGELLLTLATPKMSVDEEIFTGLVSEHNYAVIGVTPTDCEGQLCLTIQNPWSNESCAARSQKIKTTFDLSLGEVSTFFSFMFLNWSTSLYTHREDLHFLISACEEKKRSMWGNSNSSIGQVNLASVPQFEIKNTAGRPVRARILLQRHVLDETEDQVDDNTPKSTGPFIALAIYTNSGKRVISSEQAVSKTDYFGSFEVSIEVLIPPIISYTLALLTIGIRHDTTCTLTICHAENEPVIEIRQLSIFEEDPDVHIHALEGTWKSDTAGGNPNHYTYARNPQYLIELNDLTDLNFVLETRRDSHTPFEADIQVDMLWSPPTPQNTHPNMRRAIKLELKDIVATGKEYMRNCIVVNALSVKPGKYVLVLSTFKQGRTGDFRLTTISSNSVVIGVLPEYGAGLLQKSMQGVLSSVNALINSHNSESIRKLPRKSWQVWSERANDLHVIIYAIQQIPPTWLTITLQNMENGKFEDQSEGFNNIAMTSKIAGGCRYLVTVARTELKVRNDVDFNLDILTRGFVNIVEVADARNESA